jgi:hypothetical protein
VPEVHRGGGEHRDREPDENGQPAGTDLAGQPDGERADEHPGGVERVRELHQA